MHIDLEYKVASPGPPCIDEYGSYKVSSVHMQAATDCRGNIWHSLYTHATQTDQLIRNVIII